MHTNTEGQWERRWHPLRQEWVVYAAHRNNRPWNSSMANMEKKELPDYDPDCYLCPGNVRVGGMRNPDYHDVFIFDNDHPVVGMLAPEIHEVAREPRLGYKRDRAIGLARVVCYSPLHNKTLSDLPLVQTLKVFDAWRAQMVELARVRGVQNVMIFENKGELAGVSNPHPHCQIYAPGFTFRSIDLHMEAAAEFRKSYQRNLFSQIIENERADEIRIIYEDEYSIAFIPFFARYAFELYIAPKQQHFTLATLSDEELASLARAYHTVVRKYDKLFGITFPYVMTLQQAPFYGYDSRDFYFHIQIQPPLRAPGLQKFLGGPETGGMTFMADTMPEAKAAQLREVQL